MRRQVTAIIQARGEGGLQLGMVVGGVMRPDQTGESLKVELMEFVDFRYKRKGKQRKGEKKKATMMLRCLA